MKKILSIFCMLLIMTCANAQTYDTLSAPGDRLPGFHYTWWYDTCVVPFYDTVRTRMYVNCLGLSLNDDIIDYKSDSVDHLAAIVGFGVWQDDRETLPYLYSLYTIRNKTRLPEYVKVFHYDPVNDTMIPIDSARWDTAAPKILKLHLNYDTVRFTPRYVKLYEVHLDTPIYVDSTFYLAGTTHNNVTCGDFCLDHVPSRYAGVEYSMWSNRTLVPDMVCPNNQKVKVYNKVNGTWCNSFSNHWGPIFGCIVPMIDYSWVQLESADSLTGRVDRSRRISKRVNYTFSATPARGYRFSHWQDGDTNNPRTIFVTQDTSFTAYFEATGIPFFDILVTSNNPDWGTAEGSDIYDYGDVAVLSATPNPYYHFAHWEDGSTDNPRLVTITQDSIFTAYFDSVPYYQIGAEINNSAWGSVEGAGSYPEDGVAVLTAVPKAGSYFLHWNDTLYENPLRVTVTQDSSFIAYFINYNDIHQADALPFEVYPNPASNMVTVACRQWHNSTVAILDAAGHEYIRTRPTGSKSRISTAELPKGIYFVVVSNAHGTSVRKLVIEGTWSE